MRVLFWVPYPIDGPSNRYRVEQYLVYLKRNGISYSLLPFWNSAAYRILYKSRHSSLKFYYFILGSLRRLIDLVSIPKYDIVFIHREAYPIGGAFFESIVAFLGKPIIFDFDDAIFLTSISKQNSFMEKFKNADKTKQIIKKSRYVIAGNKYLSEFALKYNPSTCVIPTSINTEEYYPTIGKDRNNQNIVIGWMGSVTTLEYLDNMSSIFILLSRRYPYVKINIVGGNFLINGLDNIKSKEWALNEEKDDLNNFDIGIMPMPHSEWSEGKCGFKAILYMSMAIPCVCSPVGVVNEIIRDGQNGFFADSETEWVDKLSRLIEDAELRRNIGLAGRETVEQRFSVKVNVPKFLEVIRKCSF